MMWPTSDVKCIIYRDPLRIQNSPTYSDVLKRNRGNELDSRLPADFAFYDMHKKWRLPTNPFSARLFSNTITYQCDCF